MTAHWHNALRISLARGYCPTGFPPVAYTDDFKVVISGNPDSDVYDLTVTLPGAHTQTLQGLEKIHIEAYLVVLNVDDCSFYPNR